MKEQDVRIDIFTAGPRVSMRLTHCPTGIVVAGGGQMQHKLRKRLWAELEEKVNHAPSGRGEGE